MAHGWPCAERPILVFFLDGVLDTAVASPAAAIWTTLGFLHRSTTPGLVPILAGGAGTRCCVSRSHGLRMASPFLPHQTPGCQFAESVSSLTARRLPHAYGECVRTPLTGPKSGFGKDSPGENAVLNAFSRGDFVFTSNSGGDSGRSIRATRYRKIGLRASLARRDSDTMRSVFRMVRSALNDSTSKGRWDS